MKEIGIDTDEFKKPADVFDCIKHKKAETIRNPQSKIEFELFKSALSGFAIYPVTKSISNILSGNILNYTISHTIEIPDLLIADTTVGNNLKLYTENVKHFSYFKEIKIYYPRS